MLFSERWKAWIRRARALNNYQRQYRKLQQRQPLFLEPLEDRLVLSNAIPAPGVDPSTAPSLTSPPSLPPAAPSALTPASATATPALSGTWTAVTVPPEGAVGTMFVLPNGNVMAQGPGVSNTWYQLAPNTSGNYASGSWSPLASMSTTRLYTGSVILPSDQLFIVGGEYTNPLSPFPTYNNTGEIYNIATNTWSRTPNFPQSQFGDDPTVVLPNGNVLCGYLSGPQTYLYHPSTNTWSPGPTKLDGDASDEETWVVLPVSPTLPQGGVLSYSIDASVSSGTFMGQVYNIATNTWMETQNSITNPPKPLSSLSLGEELGGAVMLPNGMIFQIGGNQNTALYDPSTNTWSAGPQIKDSSGNIYGADDAPASILPDGQVVFTADAGPALGTFSPPTKLFDYDYTTNTITDITPTLPLSLGTDLTANPAYVGRTLVLPNGQLLFNSGDQLWTFTPSDSPQDTWRPTITGIVNNGGGSYTLTGTQLTGISEGSSYGDDVNVSENYPIVQLTGSSGDVYYATTSNWSPIGISAVGSGIVQSVDFNLPIGLPNDTYQMTVIANGISSLPQTIIAPASPVRIVAGNSSATYRPSNQNVSVSATVTADIGNSTVGEGTVTFTIKDTNGNTIGIPVTANVSGGKASTNFNLPADTPIGSYYIDVNYTDGFGNYLDDGADTKGILTINSAGVQTTAQDTTAAFNSVSQIVQLTAAVSNGFPSDKVGEGQVTFTVKDSSGTPIGTILPASVIGGVATAYLSLPANTVIGTYTITVSYNDSLGNFTDNGDASGTLTIGPDNVATTAADASAIFSPNAQSVTLNAILANKDIPTNTVNEGTVTFTVMNGGTVVGTPVQGTVSAGQASANFAIPLGLPAGNYTVDVAYTDSQGSFLDSADTSATLTVAPANVTTTASKASAVFSPNAENVTLNATLTDTSIPGDLVSEGIVTFTIMNGSTVIGTPLPSTVSGGVASTVFNVPAGLTLGNYTIAVSYSDSQGNFTDKADNNAIFSITPANVTTTVSNVATVFNPNAQNIALNATLANTSVPSDLVNEGIVTFTIQNGGTTLGSVQGTVSGGKANATFNLPAGQTAGNYTIVVSYSDSLGQYTDAGDTNAALSVAAGTVTTTANSIAASFNTAAQTLSLHAAVTDAGNTNLSIDEGTVTFTIFSGSSYLGSVQSNVSAGAANTAFTLPAGLAAGAYTIAVHYSDSLGNFTDSADNNGLLLLNPAGSNTVLTQVVLNPNLVGQTATETLTAHVNSSTAVSQGSVTFSLSNLTVSAPVDANGNATASVTLPMLALLAPQGINVQYADPSNNLASSNSSETASWQSFNAMLPSTATFSDTGRNVSANLYVLMLNFSYNAQGLLTEVDIGPYHLVFNYNASNVLTMVTMNGLPLLVL